MDENKLKKPGAQTFQRYHNGPEHAASIRTVLKAVKGSTRRGGNAATNETASPDKPGKPVKTKMNKK